MAVTAYFFNTIYYFTAAIITILFFIYSYFRYQYTHWKKRNIYSEKPHFPYGNLEGVGKTLSFSQNNKRIYDLNKGKKVVGIHLSCVPVLLVRDLNIIKKILIKDFDSFVNRGIHQASEHDPLSVNVFFVKDQKWKSLRTKLTPAFTSSKLKAMFSTILKCAYDVGDHFETAAATEEVVKTGKIMSMFTLDVLASCAFGVEMCSIKNFNSKYLDMVDAFMKPNAFRTFINGFLFIAPKLAAFLRLKQLSENIEDFFTKITWDTVNFREKNNICKNDLMQLLIELKNKGKMDCSGITSQDGDHDLTFTMDQVRANVFIFFFAGVETSASALMYCLFELALNLRIQDKLREEMDQNIAKYDGEITYDGIHEMEYLDQVVSETLRKYPPGPDLFRCCTKPYYMSDIDRVIEKDTRLLISVLGLHHDPQHWPNPEKFDPDRFLPENREKRDPMCYLPFGDGPRNCIGFRFGLLEMKLALTVILSNFKVTLSDKTKIPLESNPRSPLIGVKDEIYLKILKR